MKDQELQEYIEQYLDDQLTIDEKDAFEERLLNDAEFKEEVEIAKEIISGIEGASFRKQMALIHEEETKGANQQIKPAINLNWIYGIAATITLVIIAWWLLPQTLSNDALFDRHFQPYGSLLSVRGDNYTGLEKAMKYYGKGQFAEAIELLEKDVSDKYIIDQKFYLGISYLGLKKPKQAITHFENCLKEGNKYKWQIKWYLGLAYILDNQYELAIQLLEQINKGEFQYKEAKNLIESMQ